MERVVKLQDLVNLSKEIGGINGRDWLEIVPEFKELTGKELLEPVKNGATRTKRNTGILHIPVNTFSIF